MLFECVIYLESVPLDSINLCRNLDFGSQNFGLGISSSCVIMCVIH